MATFGTIYRDRCVNNTLPGKNAGSQMGHIVGTARYRAWSETYNYLCISSAPKRILYIIALKGTNCVRIAFVESWYRACLNVIRGASHQDLLTKNLGRMVLKTRHVACTYSLRLNITCALNGSWNLHHSSSTFQAAPISTSAKGSTLADSSQLPRCARVITLVQQRPRHCHFLEVRCQRDCQIYS